MPSTLLAIVEGFGEVEAVPVLIRRWFESRALPAPVGFPQTWAGWGLPKSWCAEVFAAAAAFYRAAPWRYLWDADLLAVEAPSRHTWSASILGRGGESFGLVLYADPDDYARFCGVSDRLSPGHPEALQRNVLSLLFGKRRDISPAMRKEVAREGWEVAGPTAYPYLVTMNALAGGITRREADDLVATLAAVAAFVEAHGPELDDCTEGMVYRQEGTATVIELEGTHEPSDFDWLEEGGATGPGARPEAALDGAADEDPGALIGRQMELVRSFEAALRDEGLSEATVRRHSGNAEMLARFVAAHQGVASTPTSKAKARWRPSSWSDVNGVNGRVVASSNLPTTNGGVTEYEIA